MLRRSSPLDKPAAQISTALESSHLDELNFALACAQGDRSALEIFDQEYLSPLRHAVQRIDAAPDFGSEVLQLVRKKLLLQDGETPPRITEYAGRGSLKSFVRAAVLRTALNLKRDRHRDPITSAATLQDRDLPAFDPESVAIRESHRAAFQEALRAGLALLPRRDRSVLRLHLLEGLNLDAIAQVYKVHRATVARWLAHARAMLRQAVLDALSTQLGLAAGEVERLIGLAPSQLDISISRLLRTGSQTD